jgi:hypothetical protein
MNRNDKYLKISFKSAYWGFLTGAALFTAGVAGLGLGVDGAAGALAAGTPGGTIESPGCLAETVHFPLVQLSHWLTSVLQV